MKLLCSKLCLPTLANLLGTVAADGTSPALDYLQEALVDATPNDRLADVLLLYARDAETCPDKGLDERHEAMVLSQQAYLNGMVTIEQFNEHCDSVERDAINKLRLLHAVFPQATLCRWLETVGDERWKRIIWMGVKEVPPSDLGPLWQVLEISEPKDGQCHAVYLHHNTTEAGARLDLKRRVLGLFLEVARKVEHRGESLRRRELTEPVYREGYGRAPVDHRWLGAYLELDGKRLGLRHDRPTDIRQDEDSKEFVVAETLRPVDFLPAQQDIAPNVQWSNQRIDIRQAMIDGPAELYFAGQPLGRTDLPPTIEPRK